MADEPFSRRRGRSERAPEVQSCGLMIASQHRRDPEPGADARRRRGRHGVAGETCNIRDDGGKDAERGETASRGRRGPASSRRTSVRPEARAAAVVTEPHLSGSPAHRWSARSRSRSTKQGRPTAPGARRGPYFPMPTRTPARPLDVSHGRWAWCSQPPRRATGAPLLWERPGSRAAARSPCALSHMRRR
jgi:hypothetical protein